MTIDFTKDYYRHADLTGLKAHLAERLDLIEEYPDRQPAELEALIAQKHGIQPEGVLLTGGSIEAIHIIAAHYRRYASVIPQPTRREYANACRIYRHIISYENADTLTSLPPNRLYWICNPNSPSGNVLRKGFMDYLVRRSPRYTFVVDQSYEAYTKEYLLEPCEMKDVANLLIIHSIDKTYGVPGLRLGYITGHPSVISLLREQQRPWPFSSLSLEAGKYLLEQGQPAVTDIDAFLVESERLRGLLRDIKGLRVYETKTSYMLCELLDHTTTQLADFLEQDYGIRIFSCASYTGLSDHFFRVASQQPDENDALVAGITAFLEKPE